MAEAEAAPVGARNAMFLPHMSGSGCPVVDERSLGALVGLSHLTTRGDILRAIIEGLDYQTLDMMAALERGLDAQLDRLIAVGGATRNAFWMQNKADVTGRPVDVPAVEEASPLGAAILAGIGVGLYENEADAYRRVFEPGVTYQPDPKRADFYRRGYEVYRQLYPATKPISQQLGELSR